MLFSLSLFTVGARRADAAERDRDFMARADAERREVNFVAFRVVAGRRVGTGLRCLRHLRRRGRVAVGLIPDALTGTSRA
jgi:hypothetical protein